MKYFLRVIALLGLASITFAFDANISWTPPISYENGDALLEQDLDFYTLYCNGAPFVTIDSIIGTRSATVDMTALGEGTHSCALRVTALNGMESGDSNIVNFTIGPRVPNPPTLTLVLQ